MYSGMFGRGVARVILAQNGKRRFRTERTYSYALVAAKSNGLLLQRKHAAGHEVPFLEVAVGKALFLYRVTVQKATQNGCGIRADFRYAITTFHHEQGRQTQGRQAGSVILEIRRFKPERADGIMFETIHAERYYKRVGRIDPRARDNRAKRLRPQS